MANASMGPNMSQEVIDLLDHMHASASPVTVCDHGYNIGGLLGNWLEDRGRHTRTRIPDQDFPDDYEVRKYLRLISPRLSLDEADRFAREIAYYEDGEIGEDPRTGDAIALRWPNLPKAWEMFIKALAASHPRLPEQLRTFPAGWKREPAREFYSALGPKFRFDQ